MRLAAVSSFVAAVAFLPIPFGYFLTGPGRGSEPLFLANFLGAALLFLAFVLAAQASGFLAVLWNRTLVRIAAAVAITHALAMTVLGVTLLIDRVPCQGGLYCSGQTVGAAGRLATFLWFPVLGSAYLVVGALLLGDRAVRKTPMFGLAAGLFLLDGLLFLELFASMFGSLDQTARLLFLLALALGPIANAFIGAAFLRRAKAERRVAPGA